MCSFGDMLSASAKLWAILAFVWLSDCVIPLKHLRQFGRPDNDYINRLPSLQGEATLYRGSVFPINSFALLQFPNNVIYKQPGSQQLHLHVG
jgi:hypothetical protein